MKTAISIPDDLFREIETCSRRLKLSRSRFFATAAREYLSRYRTSDDATDAWNRVADEMSRSGDDRVAAAVVRHSKAVIRATMSRRA